jgi:AcrR family transcriptional regulator
MATIQGQVGAGRRADAQRNRVAILDAATDCLARDPDMSLKDIAEAAGVGRVTLYGHYESRAALVEAVVDRAIAKTDSGLQELDLSGEPNEAMAALLAVTWDLTHSFGALVVAAQKALPSDTFKVLHEAPAARVRRLLERGRASGAFRDDLPLSWQVTTIQAILHSGAEGVYRGEVQPDRARELVTATILATLRLPAQ